MMVVGNIRGLATGVLVLTTTTTLVQPSGATSSSLELSEVCPTELTACGNDGVCASCLFASQTNNATFQECVDDLAWDGVESSTALCFTAMADVCCSDEASNHACVANENFADLGLCFLNTKGCPVDEITCDEDGGPGVSSSGATATVGCPWIPTYLCALFALFLSLLSV